MLTLVYRTIRLTEAQQQELGTYNTYVLSFLESFNHETIEEKEQYLNRYNDCEIKSFTRPSDLSM